MKARNLPNRNAPDPEFDALPAEERWDATKLKDWHTVHSERAARSRKLRNIIGGTALGVAAGLGLARLTDTYELPSAARLPFVVADGIAMGVAGNYNSRSRQERAAAQRNAEIVSMMFIGAELEPPAWTQPQPLAQ